MIISQSPHKTLDTALPELAELGYDGIEIPLKAIFQYGKDKFKSLLAQCNLKVSFKRTSTTTFYLTGFTLQVIIMVFTDGPVAPGAGLVFGGPYPGFTTPSLAGETDKEKLIANHFKVFQEQVEAAQEFNPYLVNSHSCKDYFTFSMAKEFFSKALAWTKAHG